MVQENNISAEQAAKVLEKHGLSVTTGQAAEILTFLATLVGIKLSTNEA